MSLTDFEPLGDFSGVFARRVAPGGGDFGTGMGFMATALTLARVRLAGMTSSSEPGLASRTARRLLSPRTGTRSTNTHPILGTGLPPIKRPSSNSQGY